MNDNVKAQSADELFDIVDADDCVIGQATRGQVHRQGLWHRAIHVLVFNHAGQVFLQKRSMLKDAAPGCWDSSCSGHLDAGEDYDSAAVRELGEELGVMVKQVPKRWRYLRACPETGWEFVRAYRLKHEGPFTLHPAEIERGEWFEVSRLDDELLAKPAEFAPAFTYLWRGLQRDGEI